MPEEAKFLRNPNEFEKLFWDTVSKELAGSRSSRGDRKESDSSCNRLKNLRKERKKEKNIYFFQKKMRKEEIGHQREN